MRSVWTNPISWPRKNSDRTKARARPFAIAFRDSAKSSCSIAGSAAGKHNGQ